MKNNYKIFICATEQSGDNIGMQILNILSKKNKYMFEGVGGNKMSKYFTNQYFSVEDFDNKF